MWKLEFWKLGIKFKNRDFDELIWDGILKLFKDWNYERHLKMKVWNHWRIGTMKGIWKIGVKKVIKISRNKKWTSGYWTVCQSDAKWEHLGVGPRWWGAFK